MPLSGLNKASVRPRGGVARVGLIPASKYAGSAPPATPAVWAFREDKARYSEETTGGQPIAKMVRHTLEMEFAANPATRAAVDELRAAAASEGVVALVTMASGRVVVAGWSRRFGTRYPLRLVAESVSSGEAPADCPTVRVTLESTDADPASSL